MAKKSTVRVDIRGLDSIGKGLGKNMYAKVGIMGAKDARAFSHTGEPSNATLGVIHEFGTLDGKIPARSWLRFPLEYKAKDIIKFLKSKEVKKMLIQGKVKEVYKRLGLVAEGIIQDAFATNGFGQWKPNAPSTVAAKGSSAPLIDSGQLRAAVSSEVVSDKK